jgi:hypothetical protein
MALTFLQVREAFQSAIPRMRDDFARRVSERLKTIARESNYPKKYPAEVLRMAEDEVRARSAIATQRVKELLDSGWVPENSTSVRQAYGDMYVGFNDWQKDPSSDLYPAVEASFGKVGINDKAASIEYVRRLGAVQVQAAAEAMSDLDVYAARFKTAAEPAVATQTIAVTATAVATAQSPWKYDVFISHASPDKETFVRKLAEALAARGLEVWYDEHTLRLGDSLREKIDDGLKSSKHGVVVLSQAFFKRPWPAAELDGLFIRQTAERTNVILPIWHGVTQAEVSAYSPMLAGRLAANSSEGADSIADEILAIVRPR